MIIIKSTPDPTQPGTYLAYNKCNSRPSQNRTLQSEQVLTLNHRLADHGANPFVSRDRRMPKITTTTMIKL